MSKFGVLMTKNWFFDEYLVFFQFKILVLMSKIGFLDEYFGCNV